MNSITYDKIVEKIMKNIGLSVLLIFMFRYFFTLSLKFNVLKVSHDFNSIPNVFIAWMGFQCDGTQLIQWLHSFHPFQRQITYVAARHL